MATPIDSASRTTLGVVSVFGAIVAGVALWKSETLITAVAAAVGVGVGLAIGPWMTAAPSDGQPRRRWLSVLAGAIFLLLIAYGIAVPRQMPAAFGYLGAATALAYARALMGAARK